MGSHEAPKGKPSTFQQMGNRTNRDHQAKHRAAGQPAPKTGSGKAAGSDLPPRGRGAK